MSHATVHRLVGPTIMLGSGSYFDFEAPETTPLTIEDVAYGLAYTCRFAGQCRSRITGRRCFYSVAEHCVRMSRLIAPGLELEALMHDVGEATCGDMTAPLKSICPDFDRIEKRCQQAALAHFGVRMDHRSQVKEADLRMLATEKRDLMPGAVAHEWSFVRGHAPYDSVIIPWSPDAAAEAFLLRHHELTEVRT